MSAWRAIFDRTRWWVSLTFIGLVSIAPAPLRSESPVRVDGGDPELLERVRAIPLGGRLLVEGLFLETLGAVDLGLERFRVFAEDAVIRAGDRHLPVPQNAYFRGSIAGVPGSRAVVGFRASGAIEGLVTSRTELWHISRSPRRSTLRVQRLDVLEDQGDRPFECQTHDGLREGPPGHEFAVVAPGSAAPSIYSYTVRVALDTDWEFLDKFDGDLDAATDYVGDLIAFSSSIYTAEVDTNLHISYLKWWPGANGNADPWTQNGCSGALSEFRGYWIANHSGTERSIAHLLSGKSTGCGIAYVGVLCSLSSGYGVTGSLSGRFDPQNPTSSAGFWDIMAVSHEIGHNFGSSHTHCYAGTLGNPEPVDQCYSGEGGCYQGPPSLPGCSPGGRCGTIMSYCHLRTGGYGNIALTFGAGHPFGEDPWRVPTVMNNHVSTRPASCVTPIVPDVIFADDFESGNADGWTGSGQ